MSENLFETSGVSPGCGSKARSRLDSTSQIIRLPPEDVAEIRNNYFTLRLRRQSAQRVPTKSQGTTHDLKASPIHNLLIETQPFVFSDDDHAPLHFHEADLPEGRLCYCFHCIESRNCPKSETSFRDEMLRQGFTDGTWEMRESIGSDFYDDIVFLLNRIHSLSKIRTEHGPLFHTSPEQFLFECAIQQLRAEPIPTSRPLEHISITDAPDHWFGSYWKNSGSVAKQYGKYRKTTPTESGEYRRVPESFDTERVLPSNQKFHQSYLDALERVEFNHDLPSGGTRKYSFELAPAAPTLKTHRTDPKINGPYAIDDLNASFEEQIIPPTPETWLPQTQIEHARYGLPLTETGRKRKHVITNVRCMVCGAVDKQKYPKMNMLGSVKKEMCLVDFYLCNRDACARSRDIKGTFDIRRLRTGYRLHPHFMSPVHKSLWSWVRSNRKNESDPNLRCELRYALDDRGRKGIKSKTHDYDYKDATQTSGIHADSNGSFAPLNGMTDRNRFDSSEVRSFEEDFRARIQDPEGVLSIPPTLAVNEWKFDPSVHKIVGRTFEERRHLPNYYSFSPAVRISEEELTTVGKLITALQPGAKFDSFEVSDFGVTKSGMWTGDPLLWTPGHGLVYPPIKAYIIQGTAPYRINEYRDPDVSELDEVTWREKLKASWASFQNAAPADENEIGWRWYPNPNDLKVGSTIETLKDDSGGPNREGWVETHRLILNSQGKKWNEMTAEDFEDIKSDPRFQTILAEYRRIFSGSTITELAEELGLKSSTLAKRISRQEYTNMSTAGTAGYWFCIVTLKGEKYTKILGETDTPLAEVLDAFIDEWCASEKNAVAKARESAKKTGVDQQTREQMERDAREAIRDAYYDAIIALAPLFVPGEERFGVTFYQFDGLMVAVAKSKYL
jgi:hypothetical protein